MLVRADAVGGTGADELGQAVAGRAVAVFLRAAKAFALDRQHGDAPFGLDAAADRGHVVADDAHDAGRIDERRLGLIVVDQFDQGLVELLLAAVDHVAFSCRSVEKLSRCNSGPEESEPRMSHV